MELETIFCWAGAFSALIVAALALWRWEKSVPKWCLALGLLTIAFQLGLLAISSKEALAHRVLSTQRIYLSLEALLLGLWLAFSLGFGRRGERPLSIPWKIANLGIPLAGWGLVIPGWEWVFPQGPFLDPDWGWFVPLGTGGDIFHALTVLGYVLILANLERTLRYSVGHGRWQVKFVVFGLGGICGLRIYLAAHFLLFHGVTTGLQLIAGGALVPACGLLAVGVWRSAGGKITVKLSHMALYNTLSFLIVGSYLIAAGAIAELMKVLGGLRFQHQQILFAFAALSGLAVVMFSDRVRYGIRKFIRENFSVPRYDYRKIWTRFAQRTSSSLDEKELATELVRLFSETFEALCVGIWLNNVRRKRLILMASTVDSKSDELPLDGEDPENLLHELQRMALPIVDLESSSGTIEALRSAQWAQQLLGARIRYLAPLIAGGEAIGMVGIGDRVKYAPMLQEDMELMRTLADQSALSFHQIRLLERVKQAREIEAFQAMSAFLVHDLKNLSARLSLTAQNLPHFFQDPEFREDAARVINQSVDKIRAMCSELSFLKESMKPVKKPVDMNELAGEVLKELTGVIKAKVELSRGVIPKVPVDREMMKKVLVNLLLNANEAVGDGGLIELKTERANSGKVILTVKDNGRGIPKEFMEKSLFKPFRSTKSKGMGIGLFQCRCIVEAHGGQIEVESKEGEGTLFRIILQEGS
jgi:putative PEP-CTERM system histidine kinase